jgi:hypothetical protein
MRKNNKLSAKKSDHYEMSFAYLLEEPKFTLKTFIKTIISSIQERGLLSYQYFQSLP